MRYDPFDPAIVGDPYPVYEWLRDEAPVHWAPDTGTYVISRYDDVAAALADADSYSSDAMRGVLLGQPTGTGQQRLPREEAMGTLVAVDPPAHSELRRIVNRGFTPKHISGWRDRVTELVDELMTPIAGDAAFDVVAGLAAPLPVRVIAEMLGADPEQAAQFRRWADATTKMMSGSARNGELDSEGVTAAMQLAEYLGNCIDERQREPRDDLLTSLVRAAGEEVLTRAEAVGFAALLLFAGTETSTNLIGNAVWALAQHRDQLDQAMADPSLLEAVLQETLRWESPVQYVFRRATREIVLHDTTIPVDATVTLLLAAANRDPRYWGEDADQFDITRNASGHLSFGFGPHYCLGASLARTEAGAALRHVLPLLAASDAVDGGDDLLDSMQFRGRRRLTLTSHQPAGARDGG
jgi:cytochrome P450